MNTTALRVVARYLVAQASGVQTLLAMLEDDLKGALQAESEVVRAAKQAIGALHALEREPWQPKREIQALLGKLAQVERTPTPENVNAVNSAAYGFAMIDIEDEADAERPERRASLKFIQDSSDAMSELRDRIERKYVPAKTIRMLDGAVQRYRALMDELFVEDRPYSTSLRSALSLLRTWASGR